jgi:hypothetical protein
MTDERYLKEFGLSRGLGVHAKNAKDAKIGARLRVACARFPQPCLPLSVGDGLGSLISDRHRFVALSDQ